MSLDRRAQQERPEAGYVTTMTALLLIPLTLFAAFSVDVGGWLTQATRAQNAADAAALAAAAHLPNRAQVTEAARDLAASNDFEHGVDGVEVTVTFPRDDTVRVEIDQPSRFFLAKIVMDTPFEITRYADAEAVAPPLAGVPSNVLGFGPYSLDGSPVSNFWLSEGNDCTPGDEGDWRAAESLYRPWCATGTPQQQWKGATSGREGGYFYLVQIPPGLKESSRLYVFDPGSCQHYDRKPMDPIFNNEPLSTTLSFRQWDTRQTHPDSADDEPVTDFWSMDACARNVLPNQPWKWTDKTEGWTATPFTFPGNTSGQTETHLIQTVADGSHHQTFNNYAFWVRPDTGTSCRMVAADACPTISADEWLPVFVEGDGRGLSEDIFLTEVDPELEGQNLIIEVWDLGEEMDNVQILDPLDNALDFSWTTDDQIYGARNPANSCGGQPCLFIGAKDRHYPPKHPGWQKSWKFNGRMVTIIVPLDSQTSFADYPNYWFRMRYTPPHNRWVRDWITLSVRFSGDHLRLVE